MTSTCCVYFVLILNFLYDFNFLFYSCISTRNIKTLENYQKLYLSLWIIIFLFNTLWFLLKIIMISLKKLKYNFTYSINLFLMFFTIFLF